MHSIKLVVSQCCISLVFTETDMGHTEGTDRLGGTLLAGACLFTLGWALFLTFTTMFFYMPDLEVKAKDASDQVQVERAYRRTLRNVRRRWMLTYAWSAHIILAITYWAMWVQQGTIDRSDGTRVNYSRFIGEAAASFCLALNLAIFFWFENHLFVNLGYGALTAFSFVSMLFGTLESNDTQRIMWTVVSSISFVGALLWTGIAGQMRLIAVAKKAGRRGRPVPLLVGWAVLILVAVCYFGYFLFYLLGRNDQNLSGLQSRWQIELPFLILDVVLYVVTPIITYLFYHPKESHFVDSLKDGLESDLIVEGANRLRQGYKKMRGRTHDDALTGAGHDEEDVDV